MRFLRRSHLLPGGGTLVVRRVAPFHEKGTEFVALFVVTIRKDGEKTAHGHIVDSDCTRTFCSTAVPAAVLETGIDNPSNPYVGRVIVTCADCKSEYHNGRRTGFREDA
jgi:hypothetical protein